MSIPKKFKQWFAHQGWQPRPYQLAMVKAYQNQQSSLLIAPTGGGKTLAGFLASFIDLEQSPFKGLHTLYIAPLKALTQDVGRKLSEFKSDLELNIEIAVRTGDTSSYQRQKQRRTPPHILLTTPESLMLLLSYKDAPQMFKNLRCVVVDEIHSMASNKRGDFTSLCLSRLQYYAPNYLRFGLSATVEQAHALASWLGPSGQACAIIKSKQKDCPQIQILKTSKNLPLTGFFPRYALSEVYQALLEANTSLIFVNTRAQAELFFQNLWQINTKGLSIALYHGSLSKEQRQKTEALMAAKKLRAVVCTSALELGIDWGNVDLVIQLGAPKGVSRLLQRIGRSNHQLEKASRALLVPANRFEAIECQCAIDAIANHQLDGEQLQEGSKDIIPQFIVNCCCSEASTAQLIYEQICSAQPYAKLTREDFDQLMQFAKDGGYTLSHYERYHRLAYDANTLSYSVESRAMAQRHRQNIGTIVEASRLRVKKIRRKHEGKIIGEVEEYFAQQLSRGDTFIFAGQVLSFEGVYDLILEAKPAKAKAAKVPSYAGGQLPLSTFLAQSVRTQIQNAQHSKQLPKEVKQWLQLQASVSSLPPANHILVEQFPFKKNIMLVVYAFEGRKAHQTLGMLLTQRLEANKQQPLSFSVSDYGLAIWLRKPQSPEQIDTLFNIDILGDELEDWIAQTPMMKRSFRRVAMISGLAEQQIGGKRKSNKQVTFSTDLIYDVLKRYEPEHILLKVTRDDAERELLDLSRLRDMIIQMQNKILFKQLQQPSPLSIPLVLSQQHEPIIGEAMDALLAEAEVEQQAEQLMEELQTAIHPIKLSS